MICKECSSKDAIVISKSDIGEYRGKMLKSDGKKGFFSGLIGGCFHVEGRSDANIGSIIPMAFGSWEEYEQKTSCDRGDCAYIICKACHHWERI